MKTAEKISGKLTRIDAIQARISKPTPELWKADVEYLIKQNAALYEALRDLNEMYIHAWDKVGGGLMMMDQSVTKYEAAHAKADAALKLAETTL